MGPYLANGDIGTDPPPGPPPPPIPGPAILSLSNFLPAAASFLILGGGMGGLPSRTEREQSGVVAAFEVLLLLLSALIPGEGEDGDAEEHADEREVGDSGGVEYSAKAEMAERRVSDLKT